MKILTLTFLLFNVFVLSGQQTDYMKIRDEMKGISCTATDSSSVYNTILNLTAIDTTTITKNMELYYEDLGKCFWLLSKPYQENPELSQAIALMHKALYHKPSSTSIFWNLATFYNFYGDCAKSRFYMEQYKLYTKKKYWKEDYEKELQSRCSP